MAAALIPERPTLRVLREAAAGCKACDLWERGTQTVFGDGAAHARVMFVGEQPGNDEDLIGKPFVGPAGRLLDKALEEAGIDRTETYVTNVVKHFKWEPRGKRRIHSKPNAQEIAACRPWLDSEIDLVKPDDIVCLGATAAQAQGRGGPGVALKSLSCPAGPHAQVHGGSRGRGISPQLVGAGWSIGRPALRAPSRNSRWTTGISRPVLVCRFSRVIGWTMLERKLWRLVASSIPRPSDSIRR